MHRHRPARVVILGNVHVHAGAVEQSGHDGLVVGRHDEVRSLALAAEDPIHVTLGGEPEDHVRSLVHDPDVVLGIHSNGMCVGPCIQVLAYLADERTVGVELQELGGGGHIGRPGRVAAREDEDMPPRIDRHSSDLTEVNVVGQFQRIGHRFERKFRNGLCERRSHRQAEHNGRKKNTSHQTPPWEFADDAHSTGHRARNRTCHPGGLQGKTRQLTMDRPDGRLAMSPRVGRAVTQPVSSPIGASLFGLLGKLGTPLSVGGHGSGTTCLNSLKKFWTRMKVGRRERWRTAQASNHSMTLISA